MAPARSTRPQPQYVAKSSQPQQNGINGTSNGSVDYIHHPIRSVTTLAYNTADTLIHTDKYPIIKNSYNTFVEPVVEKVYKPHFEAHVNTAYEKQVSPLIDSIDTQLSSIVQELQKNQWLQRVEKTLREHSHDLNPQTLRSHAVDLYTTALHYIEQHQPVDVASFIAGVRSKLPVTSVEEGKERVLAVWHSNLEQPLIELYQAAKQGWAAKDLSIVKNKVSEEQSKLYSTVSGVVHNQYQNVLSTYLSIFDYVVPAVQATNPNLNVVTQQPPRPKVLTLSSVRNHITGRIHDRVLYRANTIKNYTTNKAQATYGTVKTLSAKHVQPVIGHDPIQIAENVYTARTQQAVAKLGEVKNQLDELQVQVQQYVAAQSRRVQESHLVKSTSNAVDQATTYTRNLAASSVNKAKSTLPQNIQVQVDKLQQTVNGLNLRNLSDIQNSLIQIRDLLAAAPQEIQQAAASSHAQPAGAKASSSLQTPAAHHGKKGSIVSPIPPEKAFASKPAMWTSPLKPEDVQRK